MEHVTKYLSFIFSCFFLFCLTWVDWVLFPKICLYFLIGSLLSTQPAHACVNIISFSFDKREVLPSESWSVSDRCNPESALLWSPAETWTTWPLISDDLTHFRRFLWTFSWKSNLCFIFLLLLLRSLNGHAVTFVSFREEVNREAQTLMSAVKFKTKLVRHRFSCLLFYLEVKK